MSTPKRKDRCPCGSGKKYKRCCIVIPKYVYLDESGNTGMNHFDPNQPFFFQGCLIASSDLDVSSVAEIQAIAAKVGETELHGNELGVGRIATIADDLAAFIRRQRLQFAFTIFEKPHFLALMIFHLIYDQGLNPAVKALAFASKIGRMMLSLNFTTLVGDDDRRNFWIRRLMISNYLLK